MTKTKAAPRRNKIARPVQTVSNSNQNHSARHQKNVSQETPNIGILGTGMSVPDGVLTNSDLEKMVDTSDAWIVSRSGIRERRKAAPGEATSDFGAAASRQAMEQAGIGPEDIGLIVCGTFTPDEQIPSTACRIQAQLGIKNGPAFDVNAACTGFIYAVSVARHMMRGGVAKHALVIGVDLVTSVINYTERGTCVLFGDGAGAVVLGPVSEGCGILGEYLDADGSKGDWLMTPYGGTRKPLTPEILANGGLRMHMDGNEIFKFAVRACGDAVERALGVSGCSLAELDLIAPHQANIRIIEAAAKRLKMPMDRMLVNIEKYGNTSAGTIPILLAESLETGKLKDGQLIAMVGFGAGMTWGAMIVRWGR